MQLEKKVTWNPNLVESKNYEPTSPVDRQIAPFATSSYMLSLEKTVKRMSRLFYAYGKFCASHPWEVMVTFLTLSICLLSMGSFSRVQDNTGDCKSDFKNTRKADPGLCPVEIDGVVIITVTRCLALIYIYYQFRNLWNLGSKYLVGVAGLFGVFSSFVFCTGVIKVLGGNFSELNQALPLFLLLSDLPKASLLAQFALTSYTREEVRENIAKGMAILGPSLTLDTMVETLAIGVGTLSGVGRVEELSALACLSVIVNYAIFMSFFPACLSLALELSHSTDREEVCPVWHLSTLAKVLQIESERAPNPVIQRVKVVMSAGLMLVHMLSRWPNDNTIVMETGTEYTFNGDTNREPSLLEYFWRRWFAVGTEQLVLLSLVCVLVIKYVFFENREVCGENSGPTMHQQNENLRQNENRPDIMQSDSPSVTVTNHDSDTESVLGGSSPVPSTLPESTQPRMFFLGDDMSSEGDVELADKEVQTDTTEISKCKEAMAIKPPEPRAMENLLQLLNTEEGPRSLTDEEILILVENKHIPPYKLEYTLSDPERGVHIRRLLIAKQSKCNTAFGSVPYTGYDYSLIMGACCENVVGYVPIPLGIAGPLLLDDKNYYIPMATTEGCLIASTNRGCRALALSGGVRGSLVADGMTRGPVVRFPTAMRAAQAMKWLQIEANYASLKEAFDSTSRFARLSRIHPRIAGRFLFIRFTAPTGDAMGMNMLSKGTEKALNKMHELFVDMEIISLSGNFCTDKKPSAVNWIEGRGKSIVCEAVIPRRIVKDVLKTSVKALVDINVSKNLVGSAMAGSIGGFNAHAANVVAAIYIATGQDPAQNVGSSNCITLIEACGHNNEDLYISCTMPSLELGTIGGGTILPAQGACLELLGVKGSCLENPGQNATNLAEIVCGTVLAAELSLLSALAAGHLVKSHMKHNRSNVSINATPGLPIPHTYSGTTLSPQQTPPSSYD